MSAEATMPNFFKRLEARIALALAKVASALAGLASAENHLFQFGSVTPAANQLVWSSTGFTPKSGKVRISAQAYLIAGGGTLAANDQILFQIFRDGTAALGVQYSVAVATAAAVADGTLLVIADVDDLAVTPNTSHQWDIRVNIGNAHTGILNGAQITLQELPA